MYNLLVKNYDLIIFCCCNLEYQSVAGIKQTMSVEKQDSIDQYALDIIENLINDEL